ncbi:uncharacterized mitochondrial protein AtMg01250-like [Rutidosis leptorrhynchoides]|uniref:uncharacterized mitochondrial protein AtMg01250-like n=1 Tax=Rutidosis leptorrhynchoides TaxID=125765 RepID=UPI003A9A1327
MACLHSNSISVLVNGSPTKEFRMRRGVRQGDPLSPYLFIIVAEGFNMLMKRAIESSLYKGLVIGKDKVKLTHLQYADDTVFFEEWNKSNLRNLIKLLICFEAM